MLTAISVSLGSSKTNLSGTIRILGKDVAFRRIGCNGDKNLAGQSIRRLSPYCQAIGLGGIDLFLYAGGNEYKIRDAQKLADLSSAPVVDGSGIKNTWELRVIENLYATNFLTGKKVLMVNAVDRPGMAKAFARHADSVIYGDVMYGLGVPIPIYSLKTMERIAKILLPIVTKCPIEWFYPTGEAQNTSRRECQFAQKADVIAGDFHYIKQNLPDDLQGKVIITNTVRKSQVEELKAKGLKTLITTTPVINGQSFGTNLLEACIVATYGKKPMRKEMISILLDLDLTPGIFHLNS